MTYKITESDAINGTIIERNANSEETADIKARENAAKDRKAEEASVQSQKNSALAKLETLGLTAAEINALIG
jgi:hypothetical protein